MARLPSANKKTDSPAIDDVELVDLTNEISSDSERRENWIKWLGIDDIESKIWSDIDSTHPEEEQIRMDVERSFVFYHNGDKEVLKVELFDLIVQVLRKHPQLSYYQGFHDIAQVILLIYGPKQARPVLETLSLRYLRDYMLPTLSPTLEQLTLIPGILAKCDSYLAETLISRLGPTPFYALSPILTLYSHHIKSFESICKIFDFIFESRSMATPLFIYAGLVLSEKNRLLNPKLDNDLTFSLLTNIVDELDGSNVDKILEKARELSSEIQLSDLKEWQTVSKYSVLKQKPDDIEIEDIEKCINEHSKEPPMDLNVPENKEETIKESPTPTIISVIVCLVAVSVMYYLAAEEM